MKHSAHTTTPPSAKIKRQNQASKSSVKIMRQNQVPNSSVKIKCQNIASRLSLMKRSRPPHQVSSSVPSICNPNSKSQKTSVFAS